MRLSKYLCFWNRYDLTIENFIFGVKIDFSGIESNIFQNYPNVAIKMLPEGYFIFECKKTFAVHKMRLYRNICVLKPGMTWKWEFHFWSLKCFSRPWEQYILKLSKYGPIDIPQNFLYNWVQNAFCSAHNETIEIFVFFIRLRRENFFYRIFGTIIILKSSVKCCRSLKTCIPSVATKIIYPL